MTSASRTSYSPESRVRTSSSSTALCTRVSSASASATVSASASSLASSISTRGRRGGLERREAVEVALEDRQPPGDPLRVGLVVPEVGGRHLLAELRDLGAHGVEVEHLLDGVHRRLELLDLSVEVGACHEAKVTLWAMAHTLVLIRHAKSDWSGDEEDIDRPLAKRGRDRRPSPVPGSPPTSTSTWPWSPPPSEHSRPGSWLLPSWARCPRSASTTGSTARGAASCSPSYASCRRPPAQWPSSVTTPASRTWPTS